MAHVLTFFKIASTLKLSLFNNLFVYARSFNSRSIDNITIVSQNFDKYPKVFRIPKVLKLLNVIKNFFSKIIQ